MAEWLKQSTSVTVTFGPFVDATDGVTPETALTITQPDIQLSKNGGAFAQCSAAGTLVHDADGWYPKTLSTTDTNTLGSLVVQIYESGALPVWREFMVVPAQVWDSLFGADVLQVDVAQWLGTAAATPTVAGVPEVDVTHVGGTAQTAGDLKASLNTIDDFLDTEIAAIQADTDDIQTRLPAALVGGRMDASVGAMAVPVTLTNTQGIKKNTALNNFEFAMYDSAGDPKTGETVTAERSIDGAAFGACANSVVEVASGAYKINLATTDLNGDVVTFKFTSAGAKTQMVTIVTVQA